MAFEIKVTPEAEQDASDILSWLVKQHAGETGFRWFEKLTEAIDSLAELPRRCKVSRESADLPFEMRELIHGKGPHVYRILFTIEANVVVVLRIRHGRRLPLTSSI